MVVGTLGDGVEKEETGRVWEKGLAREACRGFPVVLLYQYSV